MSNDEARLTLETLERLIVLSERLGSLGPSQRAALRALKERRATLRRTLDSRRQVGAGKVVLLSAWRTREARRTAL